LYEEIHLSIGRVLEDLGYETTLKPCPIKGEQKAAIPGNCFAEPVGRDLMSGNGITKLAGAAMKRTKKGILIQGTIDHVQSLNVRPEKFLVLFVAQLENLFREEVQEMEWGKGFEQERKEYVEKFSSTSWRQNRTSP
jgi:lipoate-protein ligase A